MIITIVFFVSYFSKIISTRKLKSFQQLTSFKLKENYGFSQKYEAKKYHDTF